jgi:TonB family protein
MKKFILCKLCLIVFGALLAVQSVIAADSPVDPWARGTDLNQIIAEAINQKSCPSVLRQVDLRKPQLDQEAVIIGVCESFKAAEYLITAIEENNPIKKAKVQQVCESTVDIGLIKKLGKITTVAATKDKKTMYFSAVTIIEELHGKERHGIAVGCDEEIPQHAELRLELLDALASEKEIANALDAMTTRITRAWRRPSGFQGGLEAFLRMSLASDGQLMDVRIIRTSGDALFDRSALSACEKAAPFDEVKSFNDATFENQFRSLTVKFRPED